MDTPGIKGESFKIILRKEDFQKSGLIKKPKWYWRLLNLITFDLIPYLSIRSRIFKTEEV